MSNNGINNVIFDALPAFVVVVSDDDGSVVFCNDMARKVFGGDGTGKDSGEFLNGEGLDENLAEMSGAFAARISGKWYQVSNTPLKSPGGSRLLVGFDLTDVKTADGTPEAVSKDPLTGAANRQTGLDCLDRYLGEAHGSGMTFTVCYLDLNDLKYVNDNFGHGAGDEYLKAVVSCVRSSTRSTDVCARMGGDEFLLIFPNCRHEVVENIMGIVSNKLGFINESEAKCYSIAYGIMEVNTETPLDRDFIIDTVDRKMYYMKDEYKRNRKPLS